VPFIQQLFWPANVLENIVSAAVFLIIAVVWIATMMRRSQNGSLRRTLLVLGLFIAGWILMRTVRRQIDIETVYGRYIWYGYYIFETLLPLTLVRTADLIGSVPGKRRVPVWFKWLCAVNAVLVLLVLTNDTHLLMFKLNLSQPGWSLRQNYGYGIVYYIMFVVVFTEIIGGVVLLYVKIKGSPRRSGVAALLVFVLTLMIYMAGYAVRIEIFSSSDLTMVTCMYSLIFFELCMRLGQIPVNVHYRVLFNQAGNEIQITDGHGAGVFLSSGAKPLDGVLWQKLKDSPAPIYKDGETLLYKNKINGGYAVWHEDIAAINRLIEELETTNREIALANQALSHTIQAKEHATRVNTRAQLFAALESNTAVHENRLNGILRNLPKVEPERTMQMGIAALLICFIKRQSQLLIHEMNGVITIGVKDMMIFIDELVEYASFSKIQCLISSQPQISFETRCALLLYSFFHDLLEWSALRHVEKMIVQISSGDGRVVMRLLMSIAGMEYSPPEKVMEETAAYSGLFEKEELDDMAGISLSFPLPGAQGGDGRG